MTDHLVERLVKIVGERAGPLDRPVGIILGSGLGDIADEVSDACVIGYEDLPGFPDAGVSGHAGRLVLGRIGSRDVAVLQGRAHYYEQGEIYAMKAPVRTLHGIGCETLLLTNAAGSLREEAGPGSVMLIRDHINMAGVSPLFGESGSQRFVDMVDAYDPQLCQRLLDIAAREDVTLHEGVYAYFCGPNFETPAEVRAAKILGADLVGMSTAPEVILARYLEMRVAAMSIITNYAAGTDTETLSHEHTMKNAALALDSVRRLMTGLLNN